ncbi:UNVERIFIED_CONTAM: Ferredoxin-thioredoxin reductase catalytic chain, chloroplastic [Sesamum calycinum]|uniref:Ferredoxin-thioredoxin reductase catalytic chain, chloroplastic n=2 Tax=Sesamum TaxID=4181 RepID=A0AAW2MN87_9LAMI
MRALQASTSYSVSFSIPSVARPPPTRHGIVAKVEPTEKSVEIMRKFSEQYARKSGTYFCVDKGVTSVVIKGLAEHKDTLGAPLCPCRHYDDKAAEAQQGFWNCPCVPMRERKECHCMLFLTPDNDFAGQEQNTHVRTLAFFIVVLLDAPSALQAISMEEIKETTANM